MCLVRTGSGMYNRCQSFLFGGSSGGAAEAHRQEADVVRTNGQSTRLRFGEFELDPEKGELRKKGRPVRLQPQPCKVLSALASRPGELVTREELKHQIWNGTTFVDFEQGLNFCVRQIRLALDDDAESPKFIETVPRRGYRFVFPTAAQNGSENGSSERAGLHLPTAGDAELAEKANSLPAGLGAKRIGWVWASIAILTVVAIWTASVSFRSKTPKLTDRDTIVLADFVNATGDSVFDDTLKQALTMELGQSPFLNVLSDQKVGETLAMMNRPVNEHIDAGIGREICLRTGSAALLVGAISSIGTHYLIGLKALACDTGNNLAQEQIEAANKEDVLRALSRASSSLRTRLGESLPSVQKFDVPAEATTPSLEALKSYSMGKTVQRERGEAPSIPFLKRAIELDPNFALAYAGLAQRYTVLYQSSLALESAGKAYQLRDKVTEREKLRISAAYFMARKELEKEAQIYDLWIADYPHDFVPHANLSVEYMSMGQYDKALVEGQEALRLAPDDVVNYSNLVFDYFLMDRLNEARAILDQALARKLDGRELRWDIYQVAFLRGDTAQMEQQVAWASGKPGIEDTFLYAQSNSEVYYGHVKKARELNKQAVDSSLRADSKERAALWEANAAVWEAELGNTTVARRDVRVAVALSSGRNAKMLAALASARAGDVSKARALAADLRRDNPTYTMLNVLWLPTIEAANALAQRNSDQVLAHLETAAPYELSNNLNLLPAYIRGQAYLLAHNGDAAVAEFQKLLEHPGLVHNCLQGALVRLQMGRAHAMQGDIGKARAKYEDFFTAWKGADAEIPILKKAKLEYARLQ